jgi:NhaP-type Na+/H+ and K+/H+ antiporter
VPKRRRTASTLGEFVIEADVTLGKLCNMYGLPFDPLYIDQSLADFFAMRLGAVAVGDRIMIGDAELIVRESTKGRVTKVGLEVEPAAERLPILRVLRRLLGRSGGS